MEGKPQFHSHLTRKTLIAEVLLPCWIQFYLPSWKMIQWCLGGSSVFFFFFSLIIDDLVALNCILNGCCRLHVPFYIWSAPMPQILTVPPQIQHSCPDSSLKNLKRSPERRFSYQPVPLLFLLSQEVSTHFFLISVDLILSSETLQLMGRDWGQRNNWHSFILPPSSPSLTVLTTLLPSTHLRVGHDS